MNITFNSVQNSSIAHVQTRQCWLVQLAITEPIHTPNTTGENNAKSWSTATVEITGKMSAGDEVACPPLSDPALDIHCLKPSLSHLGGGGNGR